jgi:CheY-like chemotaxis protein
VTEAATGADGLEQCRANRPDCVLLDNGLPDFDGVELLRHSTSAPMARCRS